MASRGAADESIRISIPSRLDFLGILNHTITELGEYLDLDEEVVDALAIAVVEAGTNAIQHGSPDPTHQSVEFEFSFTEEKVHVRVTDQGNGFDPSCVTQATGGPDSILESRGRGIFLMKTFMDSVDFDFSGPGGTTVALEKRRAGHDESSAEGQGA